MAYYEQSPSYKIKASKPPLISVNICQWRKILKYVLSVVIAVLVGYILYLRPWEKRDACTECQVDTQVGQVPCSMLIAGMKKSDQSRMSGISGISGISVWKSYFEQTTHNFQ